MSHIEVRRASRPVTPPGLQIIRGKKCEAHIAKCASHRHGVTDKQSSNIVVQITLESFSDSVINERQKEQQLAKTAEKVKESSEPSVAFPA